MLAAFTSLPSLGFSHTNYHTPPLLWPSKHSLTHSLSHKHSHTNTDQVTSITRRLVARRLAYLTYSPRRQPCSLFAPDHHPLTAFACRYIYPSHPSPAPAVAGSFHCLRLLLAPTLHLSISRPRFRFVFDIKSQRRLGRLYLQQPLLLLLARVHLMYVYTAYITISPPSPFQYLDSFHLPPLLFYFASRVALELWPWHDRVHLQPGAAIQVYHMPPNAGCPSDRPKGPGLATC